MDDTKVCVTLAGMNLMPKHSVVERLEAIVVHNSNSISIFKDILIEIYFLF